MSTKIYNGLRLNGIQSISDLAQFRDRARKALMPVLREEYGKVFLRWLAALALYVADQESQALVRASYPGLFPDTLSNPSADEMRWHVRRNLYQTLKDNSVRDGMDYDRELDFDCSFGVYPISSGAVLCLPFFNNQALLDAFVALPEVVSYGYWDNTDPDEDVSPEEWSQRKQDWDEALPGIGVPRECGPTIDLLGYHDIGVTAMPAEDTSIEDVVTMVTKTIRQLVKDGITQAKCAMWCEEHPTLKLPASVVVEISRSTPNEVLDEKTAALKLKVLHLLEARKEK